MRKNKNTVFNSASSEYERLLKDFMRKDAASPVPDTGTFSYKGCAYEVPVHDRNTLTVSFSGLRLSWGKQSFTPGQGEAARFFAGGTENASATFSLYMEETCCTDDESMCLAAFYIYREGCPHPLAECNEHLLTGYQSQSDFAPADEAITPGRYFLLTDGLTDEGEQAVLQPLGRYLYLPFAVMEDGECLTHPQVQAAEAARPADELATGPCTSGTLLLSVHCAAPVPVECEYAAFCFTPEGRLVGRDDRLVTKRRQGERTLRFRFRSEEIWMPDRHTVVLTHNRVPFAALAFDYTGQGQMPAACRVLSPADWEYGWVRLLAGNFAWQSIKDLTGLAQVRPGLVELSRWSGYNAQCQQMAMPELRENVYAAVIADCPVQAQRLAQCLPDLLEYGTTSKKLVDCAEWLEDSTPDHLLDNRTDRSYTLYNISPLCSPRGRAFLAALEEAVDNTFFFWTLTLCGTEEEMQQLFACSPLLARAVRPEYRFRVTRPSVGETVHLFQQALADTPYCLDAGAENELARQMAEHHASVCRWMQDDYTRFVLRGLLSKLKQRVHTDYVSGRKDWNAQLNLVKADDIALGDWLQAEEESTSTVSVDEARTKVFEESMQELESLVGLQPLKESLSTTFCRMRFNECRRRMGLPVKEESSHHIIFTGNPGTGKTTVARLLGRIYHALGVLSKGEVIATERRELVGEYIGQTEENMNKLLLRARGNVLFIDEAYSLFVDSDDKRDYGNRVIECLLPVLAEPNPDLLVVLAGYPDEMECLLRGNPGLRSRFPHHYHFDDYTADELMQIARNTLSVEDYRLTPEAESLLHETVEEAVRGKDRYFANARWINTFLASGVLPAMARRVMNGAERAVNADLYRTVERADVEEAVRTQMPRPQSSQAVRPRIGFKA